MFTRRAFLIYLPSRLLGQMGQIEQTPYWRPQTGKRPMSELPAWSLLVDALLWVRGNSLKAVARRLDVVEKKLPTPGPHYPKRLRET